MQQVTPELIAQMAAAIVREVDPEAVVLFGSHARGQAGPDSDVDLLVVEAEPFGAERPAEKALKARRALAGTEYPTRTSSACCRTVVTRSAAGR